MEVKAGPSQGTITNSLILSFFPCVNIPPSPSGNSLCPSAELTSRLASADGPSVYRFINDTVQLLILMSTVLTFLLMSCS
jgi:hypothetical protein